MQAMLTGVVSDSYQVTMQLDQTASQILSGIASAASGADADDVFLFYYSGHGAMNGSLCCLGTSGTTAITTAQLYQALNAIPGRVIVILDSCYSGQCIASGSSVAVGFNSSILRAFSSGSANNYVSSSSGELATDKFLVITACSAVEQSYSVSFTDNPDAPFGLMTRALLEGIGWDEVAGTRCSSYADTDGNGVLTLNEAYSYAYHSVSTLLENEEVSQNVQCYPAGCSDTLFHLQ